MKEVKNILEFDNGSILERVSYELAKVMENIQDPNTDEKARKIKIDISLTPTNQRKQIIMKTDVVKTLRPTTSIQTSMVLTNVGGEAVAIEMSAQLDNQINLDGEVEERKMFKLVGGN